MLAQYLTKKNTGKPFLSEYLTFFSNRFTYSNIELEHKIIDVSLKSISLEIFHNKQAFKYLLTKRPKKISPYDLVEVANLLNGEGICQGFRKTEVTVAKAKNFVPCDPFYIRESLYSVFNCYHNIWNELDPYEREARLHIELVRIQPFEDGNKRTARIVTCYNLLQQNKAPIILTAKDLDEYFDYIDRYDIKGLTEMFRRKSAEEFEVMLDLAGKMYEGTTFKNEYEYNKKDLDENGVLIYNIKRKASREQSWELNKNYKK